MRVSSLSFSASFDDLALGLHDASRRSDQSVTPRRTRWVTSTATPTSSSRRRRGTTSIPDERQFRPRIDDGYWTVEDHVVQWPGPMMRQWNGPVFPGCDLVDIDARLRYMDDFGVDVQMLYTSWWLLYPAWSPATEAALAPQLQPVGRRAHRRGRWAPALGGHGAGAHDGAGDGGARVRQGARRGIRVPPRAEPRHEPRRSVDGPVVREGAGSRPGDHRARRERPARHRVATPATPCTAG